MRHRFSRIVLASVWSAFILGALSAAARADVPNPDQDAINGLLKRADPKFDAGVFGDGGTLVRSALERSRPDAPLVLAVVLVKAASDSLPNRYAARLYAFRKDGTETLDVPVPGANDFNSVELKRLDYAVGPGADLIAAILNRVDDSPNSSWTQTLFRRADDRLTKIFSAAYDGSSSPDGTETDFSLKAEPGRAKGFDGLVASLVTTQNVVDGDSLFKSAEATAYCWTGKEYAASKSGHCGVKSVTASSSLVEKTGAHEPSAALDGVNATAWCKDAKAANGDSWIEIGFTSPFKLKKLSITPGFARSDATWANNNRLKTVRVSYDGGEARDAALLDRNAAQDILVPSGQGAVSSVRVGIGEVYPGKKFKDTCISELSFEVVPE
jgi:hypothetical protein